MSNAYVQVFTVLLALSMTVTGIAGCNGAFTSGALMNARKSMANEQYDKALDQLDTGDMFAGKNVEWKAKVASLRAECHIKRGRMDEAIAIYEHLVEQYPESAEARLAEKRISSIVGANWKPASLR